MGDLYQSQSSAYGSRNTIDNTEKLGYTPVKTTGNNNAGMQTANVYVPKMGAAPNADTASSNSNTRSNSTSGNNVLVPYQISDSEKELNYMMDMLFMNGAGSSSVPSVRMAYEWVSNPDNKGKPIPQDVLDTYYAFLGGVDDKQIARSNQIAVGKDDEIGLVDEIYEAKAASRQTTDDSKSNHPYYPEENTVTLGKAGQTALGEIIKPNPNAFGTRSGHLYEAYQAGLNGLDFSRELRDNAAAGNFLDEIEKMYKAGETDAKIAGDSRSSETVPLMGTDEYVPYMGYSKYGEINWDLDYNYIEDMMFLNGAASSADPSVQMAYQYITNLENRGRKIPAEVMEAFKSFMENLSSSSNNANPKNDSTVHNLETQTMRDDQIKRSQGIAIGNVGTNNYDYDEIKKRNDNFGNFHTPTDLFPNTTRAFGTYDSDKGGKHAAIDIGHKNYTNLNLNSIYDGDVVYVHDNGNAGGKGGNGLTVIIRHKINGKVFFSAYMHLASNSVKKGDHVDPGQQIGIMGNSGGWIDEDGKNRMSVHLHLMVFTCSDVEMYSHDPQGYPPNGKSYKGTNDVTYYFYDPEEVINTGGKILWD